MNIVNLIIYIAYSVTLLAMLVLVLSVMRRYRRVFRQNSQLTVDNIALMKQLYEIMEAKDSKTIEETQGFVKFISDSREWAFTYIEDVQKALNEYDDALSSGKLDSINEAYKKLISYLPEEDVNV
jgi:hypothetical protein